VWWEIRGVSSSVAEFGEARNESFATELRIKLPFQFAAKT
jgi:hypothetical protein